MPGKFHIEVRDLRGGHLNVTALFNELQRDTIHTERVAMTSASTFLLSTPDDAHLLLLVPPATAPGGTVTLKGNGADTGMTIANNKPLVLPLVGSAQTLRFDTSADAGTWTAYFI